MAVDLNLNEKNWFNQRRNSAIWNYGYGKTQNDYERKLSGTQQGWQRADLIKQFTDARQKLPNQFNRRGIMNSGIYQKALGDFAADRTQALTRQNTGAGLKNQGYDIANSQLGLIKARTLSELEAQKADYRKSLSAGIGVNT